MIVAYDPRWPETFAAQAEVLRAAIKDAVSDVHHVGSTAVPGLSARPVIDIFLMLKRPLEDDEIAKLVALGFEHRGDAGIAGGYYFVRDDVTIYAFVAVHPAGHAMRHFRDHLIARPDQRDEFDAAKRALEAQHAGDPAAYERARDLLLLEYDKRAAMWAAQEERKRHEANLHRHFQDDDDDEEEGEGLTP
ncbi:MAG: GrpB family protein [Dehalococcoidia bacterium]